MLGIGAAVQTLKEVATIIRLSKDGDNKDLLSDVARLKKYEKAMEAAEKMFFGMDSFFNRSISEKQLTIIYKKRRKVFFDNN